EFMVLDASVRYAVQVCTSPNSIPLLLPTTYRGTVWELLTIRDSSLALANPTSAVGRRACSAEDRERIARLGVFLCRCRYNALVSVGLVAGTEDATDLRCKGAALRPPDGCAGIRDAHSFQRAKPMGDFFRPHCPDVWHDSRLGASTDRSSPARAPYALPREFG